MLPIAYSTFVLVINSEHSEKEDDCDCIDHSGISLAVMDNDESTPTASRRKATSAATTPAASRSGNEEREKSRSARNGSR